MKLLSLTCTPRQLAAAAAVGAVAISFLTGCAADSAGHTHFDPVAATKITEEVLGIVGSVTSAADASEE